MGSHAAFMSIILAYVYIQQISLAICDDSGGLDDPNICEFLVNRMLQSARNPLFSNNVDQDSLKKLYDVFSCSDHKPVPQKRLHSRFNLNDIIAQSNVILSSLNDDVNYAKYRKHEELPPLPQFSNPENPRGIQGHRTGMPVTVYQLNVLSSRRTIEQRSAPVSLRARKEVVSNFHSLDFSAVPAELLSLRLLDLNQPNDTTFTDHHFIAASEPDPFLKQDCIDLSESNFRKPDRDVRDVAHPMLPPTSIQPDLLLNPQLRPFNLKFTIGFDDPRGSLLRSRSSGDFAKFSNSDLKHMESNSQGESTSENAPSAPVAKQQKLDNNNRRPTMSESQSMMGHVRNGIRNFGSCFSTLASPMAHPEEQMQKKNHKKRVIRKFKRKAALPPKLKQPTLETCGSQDEKTPSYRKQQAKESKCEHAPPESRLLDHLADSTKPNAINTKPSTDTTKSAADGRKRTSASLTFEHNDVPLHPNTKRTYWVLVCSVTSIVLIVGFCLAWKYAAARIRERNFFVWHDV